MELRTECPDTPRLIGADLRVVGRERGNREEVLRTRRRIRRELGGKAHPVGRGVEHGAQRPADAGCGQPQGACLAGTREVLPQPPRRLRLERRHRPRLPAVRIRQRHARARLGARGHSRRSLARGAAESERRRTCHDRKHDEARSSARRAGHHHSPSAPPTDEEPEASPAFGPRQAPRAWPATAGQCAASTTRLGSPGPMSKSSGVEPSLSHAQASSPATPAANCAENLASNVAARASSVPPTSLGPDADLADHQRLVQRLHWSSRRCRPLNWSPGIAAAGLP